MRGGVTIKCNFVVLAVLVGPAAKCTLFNGFKPGEVREIFIMKIPFNKFRTAVSAYAIAVGCVRRAGGVTTYESVFHRRDGIGLHNGVGRA